MLPTERYYTKRTNPMLYRDVKHVNILYLTVCPLCFRTNPMSHFIRIFDSEQKHFNIRNTNQMGRHFEVRINKQTINMVLCIYTVCMMCI